MLLIYFFCSIFIFSLFFSPSSIYIFIYKFHLNGFLALDGDLLLVDGEVAGLTDLAADCFVGEAKGA
jgi:hypothetical protein